MLDAESLSMIDQIRSLTDKTKVTTPLTLEQIASTLGMDTNTVQMLLVSYFSNQEGFDSGVLTIPQYVNFLNNDVAANPMFASYFNPDTLTQMNRLAQYTDKAFIKNQMSSTKLASSLGMDPVMIDQLLYLYYSNIGATADWAVTLPDFTEFLVNSVLNNENFSSNFDARTTEQLTKLNQLMEIATSNIKLSSIELAAFTGMDASMIDQLFQYASSTSGSDVTSMTLEDFILFVQMDASKNENFSAYFDSESLSSLEVTYSLLQAASSGMTYPSDQIASYLGMDTTMTDQIFYLYYSKIGATMDWTMSVQEFIDFLLSKVITNPQYSSNFDQETIGQLTFLQNIINATASDTSYTATEMADILGMDSDMANMIYTYYIAFYEDTSNWRLSLSAMIDYIVNDLSQNSAFKSMFDQDNLTKLTTLQKMINATVEGTEYTAAKLSNLLGIDAEQSNQLFLLYTSKYGSLGGWKLSVQEFVDFIISDVLTNDDFSDQFNKDTKVEIQTAKRLIDASVSGNSYTSNELTDLMSGLSDQLNYNAMDLMYLYYFSQKNSDNRWQLSINDLFQYLSNNIMTDPRFDEFIDSDMRTEINDMKVDLDDGLTKLIGPDYSRMILTTTIPDGSDEANAFIAELISDCDEILTGNYYLVGNTPMTYEMSQTFDKELDFITILTCIAIFIVVALTFRSLLIPLILVLIIQGGIYLTISTIGIQGYRIYYLALLIVECILMGATIDYGILFTNYFRENRLTMNCQDALIAAYNGSIHTILTSGLIMALVTGIVGYAFTNPTVGQICQTISKGAVCAMISIIFILPGIHAIFDKRINKLSGSK